MQRALTASEEAILLIAIKTILADENYQDEPSADGQIHPCASSVAAPKCTICMNKFRPWSRCKRLAVRPIREFVGH